MNFNLTLHWRRGKDGSTQYAKTAFGEYVVESGWMGWFDCGLYPAAGVAWTGRSSKSAEVCKRRCQAHYARTALKLLREVGAA